MVLQDLGLYVPDVSEAVFRFHFNQIVGPARENWTYYSDSLTFNNSQHQRKIACFQIPYPYDVNIEQEIDSVYASADIVIILGSELHARTVDFVRRFDRPKMCWFLCGFLNDPIHYGRTYKFLDWFITTVHFYKNVRPSTLYELNPYAEKPYMFDALLGRKKTHRTQAYNFINENNLSNQGIVTYVDDHAPNFYSGDASKWIWEDRGMEEHDNIQWTVERINYYGYRMSLSQVIPINVYNQTAYSLVCETNFDNDYVFFTEKTVKPILARRLFITLSNRFSLEKLKELGFRTFHGIINESYDSIKNPAERHAAALEQLHWLCKQDQSTILNQCREIVEHNFNLMYGNNWHQVYLTPLINLTYNR